MRVDRTFTGKVFFVAVLLADANDAIVVECPNGVSTMLGREHICTEPIANPREAEIRNVKTSPLRRDVRAPG